MNEANAKSKMRITQQKKGREGGKARINTQEIKKMRINSEEIEEKTNMITSITVYFVLVVMVYLRN